MPGSVSSDRSPTRGEKPLAFTKGPVTLVIIFAYLVVWSFVIYVHETVPGPRKDILEFNVDIEDAYSDLKHITKHYHPYNSHANDKVRNWLLLRIEEIVQQNEATFDVEQDYGQNECAKSSHDASSTTVPDVHIFNDLISNATFSASSIPGGESVYFEGSNVMVYVRGSADDNSTWWRCRDAHPPVRGAGVLVNAHYDSVSTGFGATDDGVGVVTLLQLLRHFTTRGYRPERGIVLLFNNGEEDYLNGARAFVEHPLSEFVGQFLNLEGAGAGGRAALFRSTDTEVTRHYKSSRPCGTVVSDDGFKRRVIRSETDYAVFTSILGMRGLDVAFFAPRARYHTREDSTKFTSRKSIYHMLIAALRSTTSLSQASGQECEADGCTRAVWFDLFGQVFALFSLTSLFAVSVTLLVTVPIGLLVAAFLLRRSGKLYLFSSSHMAGLLPAGSTPGSKIVKFGGWKGFFRFPIAFAMATAADFVLALWIYETNPYVAYSSTYIVWSAFLALWFLVVWFFLRAADYVRPTALQRVYGVIWLTVFFWIALVIAAAFQDQLQISGTYPITFFFTAFSVSTILVYVEFLGLPNVNDYRRIATGVYSFTPPNEERAGMSATRTEPQPRSRSIQWSDRPSESTRLLSPPSQNTRPSTTYGVVTRRVTAEAPEPIIRESLASPYGEEQLWSGSMSIWLWIAQFAVPLLPVVLVSQIGLFITSAMAQSPADGSSPLTLYLFMAMISCLVLAPVAPFTHRVNTRVPVVLLVILVCSMLYCLTTMPFTQASPLKVFFQQQIDLDSGVSNTVLMGVDGYLQDIVAEIPSTEDQDVVCIDTPAANKNGIIQCTWPGELSDPEALSAALFEEDQVGVRALEDWVSVETSRPKKSKNTAVIKVSGVNTRACKLQFSRPIKDYIVTGSGNSSGLLQKLPPGGPKEIRLWSRQWDHEWEVTIWWEGETPPDGAAVCLWSDVNVQGLIPAFDEVVSFIPSWAIVSKAADGLVEGRKAFLV